MSKPTIPADFGQLAKRLLFLASPMAVTQLVTFGSGFICMAMLASLGREVLAASALIFSTRITILLIGGSILFSLGILIGHAQGSKNYARIGSFVRQAWLTAILISIPLMIVFWHVHSILILLGQTAAMAAIVQQFFHANVWNILPFLLSVCNQQLLYATRKQHIDLISNLVGIIVLLISSYLLIFGKLGFPKLGVAGLGYAMDLQGCTYLLLTSLIIHSSNYFKLFSLFEFRLKDGWSHFKQMLQIGWPISFQVCSEMLSLLVSTAMVGWLGTKSLAAYQVVIQYFMLVLIPVFALAQASGILISNARGGNNYHEIKNMGQASILFALIMALSVALLFLLLPRQLASLYLNVKDPGNAEIVHLIMLLFVVTAFSQLFDGIRNVFTGMLRGLFDTQYPMFVSILAIWLIGIPLSYLFAFTFHVGVVGVTLGFVCGLIVGLLLLMKRWYKLTQKY